MMNAALHFPGHRRNSNAPRVYATEEDFQQLFFAEITDLFRLSLQLTANAEKAERCLVDAMRDCFGNSAISRKFARVWAHRMIIRNAIRLVLGVHDEDVAGGIHLHLFRTVEGRVPSRSAVTGIALRPGAREPFDPT